MEPTLASKLTALMTFNWINLAHIHRGYISKVYHHKNQHSLIAVPDRGDVVRYSIPSNKWENYYSELKEVILSSPSYIVESAINFKTNEILFVYGPRMELNASLATLKLNKHKTKTDMKVINKSDHATVGSSVIVIKNELHLIGGMNRSHLRWNKETNQFEILHLNVVSESNIFVNGSRLVGVGNRVISFGGHWSGWLNCMMEYDIIKDVWKRLKITMPKAMTDFGCTAAMNDRYILLFGGIDGMGFKFDDIYVYSVWDESFRKSRIKCPKRGKFHAVAVNDKEREELCVHGYVRHQWHQSEINEQLFPPRYLIQIMRRYYHKEYIHLFQSGGSGNSHWKKDVFDIL